MWRRLLMAGGLVLYWLGWPVVRYFPEVFDVDRRSSAWVWTVVAFVILGWLISVILMGVSLSNLRHFRRNRGTDNALFVAGITPVCYQVFFWGMAIFGK